MGRTRDIRIELLGTMNVCGRCCDIYCISVSLNLQVVLKEMLRIEDWLGSSSQDISAKKKKKCLPSCDARGKPKIVGLILWGP